MTEACSADEPRPHPTPPPTPGPVYRLVQRTSLVLSVATLVLMPFVPVAWESLTLTAGQRWVLPVFLAVPGTAAALAVLACLLHGEPAIAPEDSPQSRVTDRASTTTPPAQTDPGAPG
jgi:hypothetical protein